MEKSDISACIVSYGGYEEVVKGASSILSCTKDVDLQLYLVDNHSPDGTGEKLAATAFGSQVQVICLPKNVGFGSGHNAVLPLLKSRYHVVINPDITLDTDAISALCRWMDDHPDVVMATPRLLFPDGREQYTAKRVPTFLALLARQTHLPCLKEVERHYLMRDEDLSRPQEINFCTGCFFVIRTEVFRAMGGFDEKYFMYASLWPRDVCARNLRVPRMAP
jgi:GT2 family glycosyltransferase